MKPTVSLALAAAVLTLSCKDATSPKFGPAANIVMSGEIGEFGIAGELLPLKPSVLVTDAESRPVSGVTVTFTVLNGGGSVNGATQVTNSSGIATLGGWTLGQSFGLNRLIASAPNLPAVEFRVKSLAPDSGVVAFDVADPVGDTAANPTGKNPAVDILRVRGDFKRDSLILTVTFASPVRAGSADAANSIGGEIELDMDDNSTTGYGPPDSNRFGGSAVLGVDYVVNLFSSLTSSVLVFSKSGFTRATISYPANSIVIRMPLSMLGDDDGDFGLAINLGPYTWASDIFPNAGQVLSRRNGVSSAVVSRSVMVQSNSGPPQPDWRPKGLPGW